MKFENFHVLYMLRQASLTFFKLGSYPAYTTVDGKIVEDKSAKTEKFKQEMRDLQDLMNKVSSRVERGMKVPRTWIRRLQVEGFSAVVIAEKYNMTFKEWADHFHRSLRFLEQYKETA